MRLVAFLMALGWLVLSACVRAQAPDPPAADSEARQIVDALVEARAALKRGHFRAVGTVERVYTEQGIADVLPSEIEGIFDDERGLLRYETHGQWRSTISSSQNLTPEVVEQLKAGTFQGDPKVRNYLAMFARTPEYMVQWYAIGRHEDEDHATCLVEIEDSDKPPTYRYLLPFEPSAAGLFNPMEFTVRRNPAAILEPLLNDSTDTTVETMPDGQIKVSFLLFQDTLIRSVTIDPARGFTATRMEITVLDEKGVVKDLPRLESTAQWEERNGAWVPVQIQVARYSADLDQEVYDYAIEWQAVNPEAFDERLFTYQSFEGVWDGTEVIERRDGQLAHIDTIGAPFEKIPTAGELVAQSLDQPQPMSTLRVWIIVLNALALGAIGVWLIVRGLRPRPRE